MADKPNEGAQRKNSNDGKDHKKNGSLGGSIKERKKDGDKKDKKEKKEDRKDKDKKTTPRNSTAIPAKKLSKSKDLKGPETTGALPLGIKSKENEGHAKRDSLGVPPVGGGNTSPVSAAERRLSVPVVGMMTENLRRPSLPPSQRFSTKGDPLHGAKGETPSDFIFQSLMGEFKEQVKRKIEEMMAWELVRQYLPAYCAFCYLTD